MKELEGVIVPGEEVVLRARTSGQIARILVTEGTRVGRGQPLFQLDPSLQLSSTAPWCQRRLKTRHLWRAKIAHSARRRPAHFLAFVTSLFLPELLRSRGFVALEDMCVFAHAIAVAADVDQVAMV